MGSIQQKAMYSFKLLDQGNKGYITEEDINKMMSSVFEVWNIMTNSKVVVLPVYVKEVYRQLDKDGDGNLDFDEYQQLYLKEKIVFGWYEYLNQGKTIPHIDEYFIKEMSKRQEQPLANMSPLMNQTIDNLKGELGEAMRMIAAIENKSLTASRSVSPIMTPTRSRSITPTPRKISSMTQASTYSASPSKSGAGTGVRSRTLTTAIYSNREFKGPMINEIITQDYPEGDLLPMDPLADDDVLLF